LNGWWCGWKLIEPGTRLLMTVRFAPGGCIASASAAFHPPAYHAHDIPLAVSVSPMVFAVCGGSVYFDGSAYRGSPPSAGGTAEGWYGA
jgi:hypothetical protein